MRTAWFFGIVILVAGCMYAGVRLTRRLPRQWRWGALAVALIVYVIMLWTKIAPWIASDIAVILVAMLAASVIGVSLNSVSALIVFCITAGIIDFFSFSGGLTAKIIVDYQQRQGLWLQYLSISAPIFGQMIPIIGVGDLIVMGSVYSALLQLGYGGWLPFLFPLIGLLVALCIGLWIGGIYALPFIGGTTILYLLLKSKVRTLSAREKTVPS